MTISDSLWMCRTCGMVRACDQAPWCRHYALDLPARRMVALPESHPMFGEPVEDWREEAIVRDHR